MDILGFIRDNVPNPFRPEPYLITPLSDEEKRYGKPTLLLNWQLRRLLEFLPQDEEPELYEKLCDLLSSGR